MNGEVRNTLLDLALQKGDWVGRLPQAPLAIAWKDALLFVAIISQQGLEVATAFDDLGNRSQWLRNLGLDSEGDGVAELRRVKACRVQLNKRGVKELLNELAAGFTLALCVFIKVDFGENRAHLVASPRHELKLRG